MSIGPGIPDRNPSQEGRPTPTEQGKKEPEVGKVAQRTPQQKAITLINKIGAIRTLRELFARHRTADNKSSSPIGNTKTVESPPTGLIERITQEQDLLDKFHFQVVGGNSLVQDSQFVCLADTNHLAPSHANFGDLIKEMANPDDITLVEAADAQLSREVYDLPGEMETRTWENDEQYYLTLLLLDRRKAIVEKRHDLIMTSALQAVERSARELQRQKDLLNHPELIDHGPTASTPPLEENQSLAKAERLTAAADRVTVAGDKVAIEGRNAGLKKAMREVEPGKGKRIFIIAGEAHFTDDVINTLNHHPYIILRPTNLPPPTTEDVELLKKPRSAEERARVKKLWLTARQANRTTHSENPFPTVHPSSK